MELRRVSRRVARLVFGFEFTPEGAELRARVEAQFTDAMSWDNYGTAWVLREDMTPVPRPALSATTRAALRATRLGKRHSPETIEKIRSALTGRRHSPETIAKIRASTWGRSL